MHWTVNEFKRHGTVPAVKTSAINNEVWAIPQRLKLVARWQRRYSQISAICDGHNARPSQQDARGSEPIWVEAPDTSLRLKWDPASPPSVRVYASALRGWVPEEHPDNLAAKVIGGAFRRIALRSCQPQRSLPRKREKPNEISWIGVDANDRFAEVQG